MPLRLQGRTEAGVSTTKILATTAANFRMKSLTPTSQKSSYRDSTLAGGRNIALERKEKYAKLM